MNEMVKYTAVALGFLLAGPAFAQTSGSSSASGSAPPFSVRCPRT